MSLTPFDDAMKNLDRSIRAVNNTMKVLNACQWCGQQIKASVHFDKPGYCSPKCFREDPNGETAEQKKATEKKSSAKSEKEKKPATKKAKSKPAAKKTKKVSKK